MFCRHCGRPLSTQANFCTACGAVCQPHGLPTNNKSLGGKRRLFIILPLIAFSLALLVLAVWQAGRISGTWQELSLRRAASAWEQYDERDLMEAQILEALADMADLLEAQKQQEALAFIHPDHQEQYRQDFSQHPDRIPVLVESLRSAQLTFLSTPLDAYDTERMARVDLTLPAHALDSQMPDANTLTLTLVLYEDRWVIDS